MTERYGVNYRGNAGQNYSQGYGQSGIADHDWGYGQNGTGYSQGYAPDYGQNYGQGYEPGYAPDYGQNYGQGYEQSYHQNSSQNDGGQYAASHEETNYEAGYAEGTEKYDAEDYRQDQQEVSSFSKAGILKLGAAFLILVYIVLLLIYTSGSTKPFEEVAGAVEPLLDKESLVRQDAQALKRYYGLNSADYEGVLFYSAEFSISAQEVLLIEVKTDQQVHEVRDAIEERLESRKNTFEGYAPEQAQLIGQAQIQVRGRFLFLAVSPEAETLAAAFTKSL